MLTSSISLSGVLLFTLVAVLVVPALWRKGGLREACGLMVSAPAWLVPALFTTLAAAAWATLARGVTENPFVALIAAEAKPWMGEDFLVALTMAAGLAGQVGMLEAWRQGRAPGSADFWLGIRRHTLTLWLGKLLLGAGTAAVAWATWPNSFGALLHLVPNILLGALAGTVALHPCRPLRALVEAVRFGMQRTGEVAHIVTAQCLVLVACHRLASPGEPIGVVGQQVGMLASSLSHNAGSMLGRVEGAVDYVWLVGSVFGSAVAFTALHMAVLGPRPGKESS